MEKKQAKAYLINAATIFIAICGLLLARNVNYLLFHSIAELFSVVIAIALFFITWHARKYIEEKSLLLIGIAALFIGFFDLMHTLGYQGMRIFTDYDYYGNQLWVAARFVHSLTLLIAFGYICRKKVLNTYRTFFIYAAVTAFFLLAIFPLKLMPVCFIKGQGQTTFKVISEYIIMLIFLLSAVFLHINRRIFDKQIYSKLMLSTVLNILTEASFTFYISNYDYINMTGHFFKMISFYLLYRALIRTGLEEPYNMIFKELKENEKKLEAAIGEAEKANQMKSLFLANMSHEIRTPLNSIIGFTSILLADETNTEKLGVLKIINESSSHLLKLINDILDFSKIEAGKIDIDQGRFSIHKLVRDIEDMFILAAKEKGLYLKTEFDANVPELLEGDKGRIRQLLINLIGNSLKFTAEGGITIYCIYSKNTLDISIRDTGIGISQEKLGKIFTPFEQGDSGTSKRFGGTGLGLAITKNLAESMGGSIKVTSKEGKGSTFSITLPLVQVYLTDYTTGYIGTSNQPESNMHPGRKVMLLHRNSSGYDYSVLNKLNERLSECSVLLYALPLQDNTLDDVVRYHPDLLIVLDDIADTVSNPIGELLKDFRIRHIPCLSVLSRNVKDEAIYFRELTNVIGYIKSDSLVEHILCYLKRIDKQADDILKRWAASVEKNIGSSNILYECIGLMKSKVEDLEYSMSIADMARTRFLLHTLKGTTGNLNMSELYSLFILMDSEAQKESCSLAVLKENFSSFAAVFYLLPLNYLTAASEPLPEKQAIHSARVLLVEDTDVNQKLFSMYLEKMGLSYRIAGNGAEAMELLRQDTFDLVLLDAHMPVMDGMETLIEIRKDSSWRSIPVVMLTADVVKENIAKFYHAGCSDYISKPIDKDSFASKLSGILKLK